MVRSDAVSELVSHASALEQRDAAIAAELQVVAELAERAGAVRARAAQARESIALIPAGLEELETRRREADEETATAADELRLAEERLAALERSRRRRTEETERARREVETGRQRFEDAVANVDRLRVRGDRLREEERSLRAEGEALVRRATEIAGELRGQPRVPEDASREPASLDQIEDWGQLVRSALLVARGTLETDRDHIVSEANALGASALGEDLGTTSVALVRRRLERELG